MPQGPTRTRNVLWDAPERRETVPDRFGSLALFRAAELKRCLKIGKPGVGGEGQEMAPGEGRRGPPGASRGCEVSSRGS